MNYTYYPGIVLSFMLMAAGAICFWAVRASVSGLDIRAVGVILMVIGLMGLALTIVSWASLFPNPRPRQDIQEEHHDPGHPGPTSI